MDLNKLLQDHLIEENHKKELEHERSGYLSASRLGKSSLENVLSLLGVKGLEVSPYALGVFARGNQVEDWLINQFRAIDIVDRYQTPLEYITSDGYKVIGVEDVRFKGENIPTEIKSIKNSQFKYLDTEGAKKAHILQACTYALAEGRDKFRILYVSAEDFRMKQFILKTSDYKSEVDRLARDVYEALNNGVLPEFKPLDDFMVSKKYLDYTAYPEWFGTYKAKETVKKMTSAKGLKYNRKITDERLHKTFTQSEIMERLKVEHPVAYIKLKRGDSKWQKS